MKYSLLLIISFISIVSAKAQWECPSKLAAHLDPVFNNSPLLLGAETQLSTGLLDGNSINTAMGFVGINFTTKKHSFYLEGGAKAWWKYDFDQEIFYDQYHLGVRELFYQYRANTNSLTLGLQSSSFEDYYLLNERIAGINWKLDLGRFKLNTYGGTATKDFARNGIFCTTGFIYDIQTGQNTVLIGNRLGDKNLAGLTFTFFPGKDKKTKTQKRESNEDEFAQFESLENNKTESANTDEFSEIKEDTNSKRQSGSGFKIEKIGIAVYSEFGDWINNTFYLTGLFTSIKLPGDIHFNPEILFQLEDSNKGLIYLTKLEKSIILKNGHRFSLVGGYYGFSEIDKNAMVLNSYSNILAGEVLRLDAINMPMYLLSMKYNIPNSKIHLKLQNAGQLNSGDLNEWDLEVGKKFKDQLQLNIKGGVISGGDLPQKTLLARCEMRYYF